MVRTRRLLETTVAHTILTQETWANFLIEETLPALDRSEARIVEYFTDPQDGEFAHTLWEKSPVAQSNWYSSLEIRDAEGNTLSRFSLNVPKILGGPPDLESGRGLDHRPLLPDLHRQGEGLPHRLQGLHPRRRASRARPSLRRAGPRDAAVPLFGQSLFRGPPDGLAAVPEPDRIRLRDLRSRRPVALQSPQADRRAPRRGPRPAERLAAPLLVGVPGAGDPLRRLPVPARGARLQPLHPAEEHQDPGGRFPEVLLPRPVGGPARGPRRQHRHRKGLRPEAPVVVLEPRLRRLPGRGPRPAPPLHRVHPEPLRQSAHGTVRRGLGRPRELRPGPSGGFPDHPGRRALALPRPFGGPGPVDQLDPLERRHPLRGRRPRRLEPAGVLLRAACSPRSSTARSIRPSSTTASRSSSSGRASADTPSRR
ncbi:MAG: hypothetical protein MZV70_52720 [Desulfobacterales bacterium]|nr:hypothetical protein [Desulfobacterales bacterium]